MTNMGKWEKDSLMDDIQLVINLYMIVVQDYKALKAANPDNVDELQEKWMNAVKLAKATREKLWATIDKM